MCTRGSVFLTRSVHVLTASTAFTMLWVTFVIKSIIDTRERAALVQETRLCTMHARLCVYVYVCLYICECAVCIYPRFSCTSSYLRTLRGGGSVAETFLSRLTRIYLSDSSLSFFLSLAQNRGLFLPLTRPTSMTILLWVVDLNNYICRLSISAAAPIEKRG